MQIISVGCHKNSANVCLQYKIIIMKKVPKNKFNYGVIFVCIVFFASCKKDAIAPPAPPDYFISFKADGVQKEFKREPVAFTTLPDTSGIYTSLFAAYESTVGTGNVHISLLLLSRNAPTIPAIYQDPLKATTTGGNKLPQILITYLDSLGSSGYQTLGTISDVIGTPTSLFPNLYADAKVTITEATNIYFKGTFSGTPFKPDLTGRKKIITEGKFYLPRY